jgi:hypothetical protein
MPQYVYEVKLRAVVRVRAADEEVAGKVVPTVVGPPDRVEIELANQNNAAIGRAATVTDVHFFQENEAELLKSNTAEPQGRSSAT